MTITTLFGPETSTSKQRSIKFKQVKAVYQTLNVSEDITDYFKTGERFTSPVQIYQIFRFLIQETKEMFLTAQLNGKNKIIAIDLVSVGSLNQSIVHPRNVFQTALLTNAAALILIHQHPSGDPAPSREDIEITRRLKEGGELLGIKILDHIIIGDGEYLSFVERGLL
jgi:DNA repair protein RadC